MHPDAVAQRSRSLEAEGIKYAIRLPANSVLTDRIGYLLKRPVGRSAHDVRRSHASFTYQAGSWSKRAASSAIRASLALRCE